MALACVLAVGCGSKDSGGSGGTAGSVGGTAGTSGAAGASDDCKSISLCTAFPSAHIDSLCGTKIAKTSPSHVDSALTTDDCDYQNPNGSSAFKISRVCFTSAGGGADQAKQIFQAARADNRDPTTPMPGIADEAFFRSNGDHRYGYLWVRKGSAVITIMHSQLTAETEEAMKTKCLVPIYNELAAK